MKILLLYYYRGSGGKFITNCLAYSYKVAFPNFKIAKNILKNKELLEQSLLATIPLKEKSKQWLSYEQGCRQLFGEKIRSTLSMNPTELDLNNLDQLGDVWLPLVAHDKDTFNNYLEKFKNNVIFTVLINANPAFIDFATRLKGLKDHCLNLDVYQKWNNDIELSNYHFVINNWNPLIRDNHSDIVKLGKRLGFDFNILLAKNYIEKYIDFHND